MWAQLGVLLELLVGAEGGRGGGGPGTPILGELVRCTQDPTIYLKKFFDISPPNNSLVSTWAPDGYFLALPVIARDNYFFFF